MIESGVASPLVAQKGNGALFCFLHLFCFVISPFVVLGHSVGIAFGCVGLSATQAFAFASLAGIWANQRQARPVCGCHFSVSNLVAIVCFLSRAFRRQAVCPGGPVDRWPARV